MAGNFCSKCGAPLEQSAKFCGSCGASLGESAQSQPAASHSGSMTHIKQEFATMSNNITEQLNNAAQGEWQQQICGNSFVQSFRFKYFTTQGRLNRWAYFVQGIKLFLMSLIPYILMGVSVAMMDARSDAANLLGMILILPSLLLVIPFLVASLMLGARRCHDLGHSGWLILLTMIPYVNFVFGLYLLFCPGTRGDNQYGHDPLQVDVY